MTEEQQLIEKLQRIEELFAGATTPGERIAAANALKRIQQRVEDLRQIDPPIEYKFRVENMWSKRLFVALLRRYGIQPFRYYRQRYTTVMAEVPRRFVDETLWPEFQKINSELETYLQEITDRVVKEVLHEDSSDAVVVDQPLQIGMGKSPISKDSITSQDKKPGMPSGIHETGQPKRKRKKKRKKKRRTR